MSVEKWRKTGNFEPRQQFVGEFGRILARIGNEDLELLTSVGHRLPVRPNATIGHTTAAPPSSVMHSRRRIAAGASLRVGLPHDQPTTAWPAGPWGGLNCSESNGAPIRQKIAALGDFNPADARMGSFATGSSQHEARPCLLCRASGSNFRA